MNNNHFIIVILNIVIIFNFRSKTVSDDENTTTKDMAIADKLINVSIYYFLMRKIN